MTFISPPITVRANKEYRCHWCGETIVKGETYVRWFCSEPSSTVKCHEECHDAWGRASMLTPNEDAWYEVPGDHDCDVYCVDFAMHPRGKVLESDGEK